MSSEAKPTTAKTIRSQADELRLRLRSLRRFRRKTLVNRANRLEAVLSELIAESAHFATSTPNTTSTDQETISLAEYRRLEQQLDDARREYDDLVKRSGRQVGIGILEAGGLDSARLFAGLEEADEPTDLTTIPRPLVEDVPVLHGQIEFLELELSKARRALTQSGGDDKGLREQIEVLRTQLLESRHETIELRIQNAELCDRQHAKQSELSWAERREQLILQLESEGSDNGKQAGDSKRMRELLDTTQAEIEKRDRIIAERDREIEELQMLLTRQSTMSNGLAVGAAAFADVLDSDEFIREERARLERLRTEWEEKLRIAEVEISMERARIARERLEYEVAAAESNSREAEAAEDKAHESMYPNEPGTAPGKKRRRWLSRLGIREE